MVTFLDFMIPDSLTDYGAIMFWILISIIAILIINDLSFYWSYRNKTKETGQSSMKQSGHKKVGSQEEKRIQDIAEIRNKVDRLIEMNNL